jgi:hypothetical protein
VRALVRLRMLAARLRQRRVWKGPAAREELVRRYAPGRSFADIGAMWNVNGRISFVAEESGATSVTALDLMPPTSAYEAEHAQRGSRVRFVCGDLHNSDALVQVGEHQVVWCSGVLYHSPHPLLTLQRLRAITAECLILSTETIPEVPGMAGACVFYPGLSGPDRRVHSSARPGRTAVGIDTPFERDQSYAAWWWGISPSALRGMLHASGFQILEEHNLPLHSTMVASPVVGQLSDEHVSRR